mgnify:CR=1 FL=1
MMNGQKKFFNIAGPVIPGKHYLLPLRLDYKKVHELINYSYYFILHAPRQTGKTSAIFQLITRLMEENSYTILYVNVEAAQATRSNVKAGIDTILSLIKFRILDTYGPQDPALALFEKITDNPYSALYEFLRNWSQISPKPIILFFDEIDSLIGDTLISVLRQLRTGYLERPSAFPQSICLIGVRDVKDYKIFSEEQQSMVIGGSAFNIKARSLLISDFSKEEVRTLYQQHTQETGQEFTDDAIAYAFEQTQGQPWLVNALGFEATMEELRDRSKPITKEVMERARESLILRRDTHLDVLIDRLKEERVAHIIDAILVGAKRPTPFPSEDVKYAADLGLISQQNGILQIANPIYREVIPRELTTTRQGSFTQQRASYFTADGSIDMQKVLLEFTQFYRENSAISAEEMLYKESGPHLLLMAYLQRIVNGGGRIHRECALGRGRVDLLIEFKKQWIVLELKIYRSAKTITEGLEQTAEYMRIKGATEGHLIIFDRSEKSWDEKIYQKTKTIDKVSVIEGQKKIESLTIKIWGL